MDGTNPMGRDLVFDNGTANNWGAIAGGVAIDADNGTSVVNHAGIISATGTGLLMAAIGVLVGTSAFVTNASAADLGVARKAPPPVMMQSYDWSGFYIGAQGGYAWGQSDTVGPIPNIPGFFAGTQKYDIDGGMAGGLIGWNYQFAGTPWVIGLEADLNWARIRGRSGVINVGDDDHYDTRVDWYGTVRGRLGYAWGPSLLYATGGLAYGEVRTRYIDPGVPLNSNDFSLTETRVGYTVGAGWEWMFASNWTLRAEYNYVNLGEQTLVFNPTANTRFDTDFHVVKGAITYKFGGGPVVARY